MKEADLKKRCTVTIPAKGHSRKGETIGQWEAQCCQSWGWVMGDRNRQSTEDCQGSEAALYETILMGCYSCCLINKLCLTPCNLMDYGPPSSSVPGKNAGAGSHFLLQGIFPTLGSNPHLLCWQADSLPLSHQGSIWMGTRPFTFVQTYRTNTAKSEPQM